MKKRSFPSSTTLPASFFSLLLFLTIVRSSPAQTPFVQDSAFVYLRAIAGEIGPRPMGSPNERRAMEYAVSKFREFGLQDAFIMPMTTAVSARIQGGVNTNSGIAVGVLRGRSKRTIVIGGHIDSAGPEIPGTNDDGSGAATVIELARVLSRQSHESTIVFALFGGEEEGLRGSWHFVKNFDGMDDVCLMLQIDMANGSDCLLPLVRSLNHMTPEWLVRASYEELAAAGHAGLSYPTHFYSFLEAIPGGGIGSDYEPFLEHGIAAIDFTSDVNDPIHTQEDNFENFIPDGLKRSGDLVYRLVERFDGGVPAETTGFYYLVQVGSLLLFLPIWCLWGFMVLAVLLSIVVLRKMRTRRPLREQHAKIPALKLFLLMLIIQTCVWMSETVVGLVKGDRYPWMSALEGYFVLGFLAGLCGIWIALRLIPALGLSRDPYRYALRAVVFLMIYVLFAAFRSPILAFYPAMGLFLIALSFLARPWYLKLILWLLSPHFLFRLVFSEGYGLMARALAHIPADNAMHTFWTPVGYIFFFSVLAFPFLLGFAAIRFEKPDHLVLLSRVKSLPGGMSLALAFTVCVLYLSFQPTYSKAWKQLITVSQQVDLDRGVGSAAIWSTDYLDGTAVRFQNRDTVLTRHNRRAELMNFTPDPSWIHVERTVETSGDTDTKFNILLKVRMKYRPFTLSIRYSGGVTAPENVQTPFVWSPGKDHISLNWYSFPDSVLMIPVAVTAVHADTLRELIEAVFVEQATPVEVHRPHADVASRTTVKRSTVLRKQ